MVESKSQYWWSNRHWYSTTYSGQSNDFLYIWSTIEDSPHGDSYPSQCWCFICFQKQELRLEILLLIFFFLFSCDAFDTRIIIIKLQWRLIWRRNLSHEEIVVPLCSWVAISFLTEWKSNKFYSDGFHCKKWEIKEKQNVRFYRSPIGSYGSVSTWALNGSKV
jgi:hypothetical protein